MCVNANVNIINPPQPPNPLVVVKVPLFLWEIYFICLESPDTEN